MRFAAAVATVVAVALVALASCRSPEVAPPEAPWPVRERFEPFAAGSIDRIHTKDGVFVATQPSEADLAQAQLGGVRTVIDLRPASESRGFDEPKAAAGLGLAYVHVPMGGPAGFSDETFDRARAALSAAARPVLVHCSTANRAAAVWLAWRVLDDHATVAAAKDEAHLAGLTKADVEARVLEYVARRSAR